MNSTLGSKNWIRSRFFSILQLSFINYCRDQSPLPSAFLITFVLDENSLASVNGPDKAMRLSHCYFYFKELKKQVIGIIATFLLELGTPRESSLVQRNSGCVFVKLRGLFTGRNIFDEFSFHFTKELPANSSHFEIYEQFLLL